MAGPQLLVSVGDAAEAQAALAGGADLIDIKEPSRGPLGRADAAAIAAVVQVVAGRVPVSAALGELRYCLSMDIAADLPAGIEFIKWGLAGLSQELWTDNLLKARLIVAPRRTVAVAYADWVQADAPRPNQVVALAVESKMPAMLFDTFQKDGATLLDWMSVEELMASVRTCREAGVQVALAGSLTATEIGRLRGVSPDWFAVRGAVCDGGRGGTVSEMRVRELANLIRSF